MAQARRGQRLKRGGGLVRNATDVPGDLDLEEDDVMARAVGLEPTPEAAAVMAEEYRRLLDALADETLKKVAVWRMEGYTEDAIAARLGCAPDRGAPARPDPDDLARRRVLKSSGTPHRQADMSLLEPIRPTGESHE